MHSAETFIEEEKESVDDESKGDGDINVITGDTAKIAL